MAQDAADRAYDAGKMNEKNYRGCAQCALGALQDAFDRRDDAVFQAATGLAGGGGLACDGSCGGYVGGIMFIGQLLGRERDNFADPEGVRLQTAEMVRDLRQRFIDEYGSIICRNIQTRVMGRPYYIADPIEFERFHDAGAHDIHCPEVVGLAARWAAEIVAENELA